MAVSVRFHHEDPWERIRLISAAMPNTPLNMITTGLRFIAWVPAEDDVMELVFNSWSVTASGASRSSTRPTSRAPAARGRAGPSAGDGGGGDRPDLLDQRRAHPPLLRRACVSAGRLPEMDRLYLKDPGGLLTSTRSASWRRTSLSAAGGRTLELHSHCTIGLAPIVYVEGVKAGFEVVHTALRAAVARHLPARGGDRRSRNLEAERVLARVGPRGRGGRGRALPPAGPRQGSSARTAARIRRGLLPSPASRRDGHDDPADARGAAPSGVVRRGARRGESRPRRDGLPILVTPVSQLWPARRRAT